MRKQAKRHPSPVPARKPLAEVKLRPFLNSISQALPKLIRFIGSDVVRTHPLWGQVIPFGIPRFGSHDSSGHCVRPDILITKDGPKITELDYVAGGLGCIPAALGKDQAAEAVDIVEAWYRDMDVQHIRFATASTTTADTDCAAIASFLKQRGWDARAINIDKDVDAHRTKSVIHRMFYAAEMKMPTKMRHLPGRRVITAEPWLDSKAVFALVHDTAMTEPLLRTLGFANLSFLRRAMPKTWLIATLDEKHRESILDAKEKFVIKATDVETETCWGSRAVIAGEQCPRKMFAHALSGADARFGRWPIVQSFHRSLDFRKVWNSMIGGEFSDYYPITSERYPAIWEPVRGYVGAKFGVFFLVLNDSEGSCKFIPYADTAMRTNRAIVDWSDDAKPAVFQVT